MGTLRVLIAVGLLVLVGLHLAPPQNAGSENTTHNAGATPAAAPETVAAIPTKATVRVSANQLFNAYDENEVATDEKLAGKLIVISGKVQSVDKNVWGSIYVGLRTPN
ncbi:protein of unknown function [Hyphomicrobium sp. 1Nfss2.1]|uniref:OB-fold protein n=1 Tax=Hyphomicrobium sp. 1Nfss2.1 TaxID=3413936 RepID=UPI003C7E670B